MKKNYIHPKQRTIIIEHTEIICSSRGDEDLPRYMRRGDDLTEGEIFAE